jgi:hypothetical protein
VGFWSLERGFAECLFDAQGLRPRLAPQSLLTVLVTFGTLPQLGAHAAWLFQCFVVPAPWMFKTQCPSVHQEMGLCVWRWASVAYTAPWLCVSEGSCPHHAHFCCPANTCQCPLTWVCHPGASPCFSFRRSFKFLLLNCPHHNPKSTCIF